MGGTLQLLNELGVAWVQIDEPKFRLSIAQNFLPNIGSVYHMRLHRRNAEKWWRHDRSEDRYDYLYSGAELEPFAEAAGATSQLVKKLYLYLNNHFAAKAVANAVVLKHLLDIPVAGVITRRRSSIATRRSGVSSATQLRRRTPRRNCFSLQEPGGPNDRGVLGVTSTLAQTTAPGGSPGTCLRHRPTRVTPTCRQSAAIAQRPHAG